MNHKIDTDGFRATIHIHGPMASGKTHFTREIEAILKRMREEVPSRAITVTVTEDTFPPERFREYCTSITREI